MSLPARRNLIVHYHEIGLKGRNRSVFERALVTNLRRATSDLHDLHPKRLPGRILVPIPEGVDPAAVADRVGRVFGIANYALARGGIVDFDAICELAADAMRAAPFETFAVRARAAHSTFPMSAREINEKLGAWLLENVGGRVNLSNPDRTCRVEIVGDLVLIYADRSSGPGGLPVGVSGRVAVLLSAGIDSPVAAARLMRRGARCMFVHFHSQPFTDASSVRNALEIAGILTRYQYDSNLYLAPLAPAQQQIATECPEALRTVLYRRMMVRIASELAVRDGAAALVTGDSLGQVASQTLENLSVVEAASRLPVLRPLVGMDKIEIIAEAQRLGTFDVSSAPCQEACVLFEPKSPATRARLFDVERAERVLDVSALTTEAADAAEVRVIRFPPAS
ncbi:MAG: tRNA uracil 4-sulfurtransferase ThiI [Actinomycetota bacterium]